MSDDYKSYKYKIFLLCFITVTIIIDIAAIICFFEKFIFVKHNNVLEGLACQAIALQTLTLLFGDIVIVVKKLYKVIYNKRDFFYGGFGILVLLHFILYGVVIYIVQILITVSIIVIWIALSIYLSIKYNKFLNLVTDNDDNLKKINQESI